MSRTRRLTTSLALAAGVCCLGCDGDSPLDPNLSPEALQAQAARHDAPLAVPFHGTTAGMLLGMHSAPPGRCPPPYYLLALYQGRGTATHLGRFTISGSECIYMEPPAPGQAPDPSTMAAGYADFVFTAANGDQLMVAYDEDTVEYQSDNSILWSATPYATGGTGRFAGAELVDVTWKGGASMVTGEIYSSFDGWIRYDASSRSRR
ncbi:MAG: hypothetical protein ACOC3J_03735 [Gemmatimonadota bacterium]